MERAKLILFAFVFLSALGLKAQDVESATSLEKICRYSVGDFKSCAQKLGYGFCRAYDSPDSMCVCLADAKKPTQSFARSINPDGSITIKFNDVDAKTFEKIELSLGTAGYAYLKNNSWQSESNGIKTLQTEYSNKIYLIRLYGTAQANNEYRFDVDITNLQQF